MENYIPESVNVRSWFGRVQTPLLADPHDGKDTLWKLESRNPAGSVYDRVAERAVLEAQRLQSPEIKACVCNGLAVALASYGSRAGVPVWVDYEVLDSREAAARCWLYGAKPGGNTESSLRESLEGGVRELADEIVQQLGGRPPRYLVLPDCPDLPVESLTAALDGRTDIIAISSNDFAASEAWERAVRCARRVGIRPSLAIGAAEIAIDRKAGGPIVVIEPAEPELLGPVRSVIGVPFGGEENKLGGLITPR